jgi:hypothetical protein
MKIEKISSELFKYRSLTLKLHVKLYRDSQNKNMEYFIQPFNYNNKDYMKIAIDTFLTLEAKPDKAAWDRSQNIIINFYNIAHIIRSFKTMIDNIYEKEIFAIDKNNKVILYADQVKKNTVTHIGNPGQKISMEPTVVYDENDITYEGCRLTINKNDNYEDLTIDALESIYYILNKIDLFTYASSMINMYMNDPSYQKPDTIKETKKHVLLEKDKNVSKANFNVSNSEYFNI